MTPPQVKNATIGVDKIRSSRVVVEDLLLYPFGGVVVVVFVVADVLVIL